MTSREFAEQICSTLRAAGYLAYLVGGCVRDILLNRDPADYDVATNATPERVEQIFPNSLTVGAQFGVVVVTAERQEGNRLQAEARDISLGYRLFRWPPPGRGGLHQIRRGGRQAARFHDQWIASRSPDQRSARLRRRTRRSPGRNHSRHRPARSNASAKTSSGCFAPCVLRPDSATPSSPKPCAQFRNSRRRSRKSLPNVFVTN